VYLSGTKDDPHPQFKSFLSEFGKISGITPLANFGKRFQLRPTGVNRKSRLSKCTHTAYRDCETSSRAPAKPPM